MSDKKSPKKLIKNRKYKTPEIVVKFGPETIDFVDFVRLVLDFQKENEEKNNKQYVNEKSSNPN